MSGAQRREAGGQGDDLPARIGDADVVHPGGNAGRHHGAKLAGPLPGDRVDGHGDEARAAASAGDSTPENASSSTLAAPDMVSNS